MPTPPGNPRRPIIGGNWKMNTDLGSARTLARAVCEKVARESKAEVVLIPPFPYLLPVGGVLMDIAKPGVLLGAQDVFFSKNGAFTGEVSAAMLIDCGVGVVLTGHSERRHVIDEGDAMVNAKTKAALDSNLTVILCVGETLEQRESGQTDSVNQSQLRAGLAGITPEQMARVVIAYEPVWAIGTGKTATPKDAQDAHSKIRGVLSGLYGREIAHATRIQYGGSVKGSNAKELMAMPDIDGALVGGASLNAEEFAQIVAAGG